MKWLWTTKIVINKIINFLVWNDIKIFWEHINKKLLKTISYWLVILVNNIFSLSKYRLSSKPLFFFGLSIKIFNLIFSIWNLSFVTFSDTFILNFLKIFILNNSIFYLHTFYLLFSLITHWNKVILVLK